MADEAKAAGNKCLQAKDFDGAIAHYTTAIGLDGTQHTYYSNRAAAFMSKGDPAKALADADMCIKLSPTWAKGYSRKGAALHAMKKYDEADAAYQAGLAVAPGDAALKQGVVDVNKAKGAAQSAANNPFGAALGPDLIPRLAQHPTLRHKLGDENFMMKLRMLQANPQQMMSTMFQDPDMQEPEPEVERTPEEQQAFEAKQVALAHKAKGNACYKATQFDDALEHYDAAIAADPTDVTYRNNKCAVHFEKKDYDAVVAEGAEAIRVGRDHRADYELVHKIYVRMGKARVKQGDLPGGLEYFASAQVEYRDKATERLIKNLEMDIKKAKTAAYVDPEKALAAKEEGNVKFREGKFAESIPHYEEAIKRDPKNPAYNNNLAAALTKLGNFAAAKQACEKALDLDPSYVKAIAKKGDLEFLMKEYHKALESYKKGLALEPANAACKQGLAKTTHAINSASGSDQERAQHAMADPEIQAILQDPMVRDVINNLSGGDQMAGQRALQDPLMKAKIEKLIASGILQMKQGAHARARFRVG
ncbi:hypothetical protein JL720_9801 [Aureococcus anophagefferens]|nr:hypothetical protein JL720_9801 [Aureococcus anophagefferens]